MLTMTALVLTVVLVPGEEGMAVKTHSKFVYVENPLIGLTPDSSALLSSPNLTFPHIYTAFESNNFSTLIDTKYVFILRSSHAHNWPISRFSGGLLFSPLLSSPPPLPNSAPLQCLAPRLF